MRFPVLPFNQENYPHLWENDFCVQCGLSQKRVAPNDPYPCKVMLPKLNADGSIKE
jgi:hypothetical protein